jgi:hypothetical protein
VEEMGLTILRWQLTLLLILEAVAAEPTGRQLLVRLVPKAATAVLEL